MGGGGRDCWGQGSGHGRQAGEPAWRATLNPTLSQAQCRTSLQVHLQQLQHHPGQHILWQVRGQARRQLAQQLALLRRRQVAPDHGLHRGRHAARQPLGHARCRQEEWEDVG